MKRSFYLFNPGLMERKDNTLKFTPVSIDEQGNETKQPSRFIPIEDVAELGPPIVPFLYQSFYIFQ